MGCGMVLCWLRHPGDVPRLLLLPEPRERCRSPTTRSSFTSSPLCEKHGVEYHAMYLMDAVRVNVGRLKEVGENRANGTLTKAAGPSPKEPLFASSRARRPKIDMQLYSLLCLCVPLVVLFFPSGQMDVGCSLARVGRERERVRPNNSRGVTQKTRGRSRWWTPGCGPIGPACRRTQTGESVMASVGPRTREWRYRSATCPPILPPEAFLSFRGVLFASSSAEERLFLTSVC